MKTAVSALQITAGPLAFEVKMKIKLWISFVLLMAIFRMGCADTVIYGHPSDRGVDETGKLINSASMRVGWYKGLGRNALLVFELPVLADGERILNAHLEFTVSAVKQSRDFNADLYGVSFPSGPQSPAEYYAGPFLEAGGDDRVGLQDDVITPSTSKGVTGTSAAGDAAVAAWIQGFYNANPAYRGGAYAVFRLNPDVESDPAGTGDSGYGVRQGDIKTTPVLRLVTAEAAPVARTADRPNILVIMADDLGYSDIGCFGSEIPTPNLDRLADNGIRYTQMYNTSKCYPSRACLLTGNYFQQTSRSFDHTATAGEVLRPAGYRTGWAGKHHSNFNPYERGFDHFSGFLGGAVNSWCPGGVGSDGKPVPGEVYRWAFDEKTVKPFRPEPPFYTTTAFTDWALEWLNESDGNQPWFLFVAYNAPHWPLHAPAESIEKFKGMYDLGYDSVRQARYQRQLDRGLLDQNAAALSAPVHKPWKSLSDPQKRDEARRMEIYAAMIYELDQNVGRMIARIEELGQLENTLIFFMSDNGACAEKPRDKNTNPDAAWGSASSFEAIGPDWANVCNTPWRKWKTLSHEGGINTPMIVHWPKGITRPGSICRDPFHLIDLLPTWMELSGATFPGESLQSDIAQPEGVSLVPTFRGESVQRDSPLFFEFGVGAAVRDKDWKLVRAGKSPWELYNLRDDRSELNNLAERFPERVESMRAQWDAWMQRCSGPAHPSR